jgi:hypothetical protein
MDTTRAMNSRAEALALGTGLLLKDLPKEDQESILRDMASLARVKSAASRGMVIIEMDKELFESMVLEHHIVTWTLDELGFSAPIVRKVD